MRITIRGRYALRAALALAKLGNGGDPVSISTLSEQEAISPVFLEQIFFKLRKAGVVESIRGPGGGFCFARPLNKVTIRDVLYAAGEDLDLISCEKKAPECDRLGQCLSHAVWTDVTILINNYFNSITLAQVIKNNRICDKAELEMEELLNGTTGS